MAANISPIFPLTPNAGISGVRLTTAMTNTKAYDGTETAGTALAQVFLAGADGARLDTCYITFNSAAGATASGTTAANLVRLWLNNGGVNTTAANNQFIGEVAIAANATVALATAANPTYSINLNRSIPAGYKLYAGTTVAIGGTNCALQVTASGGDY